MQTLNMDKAQKQMLIALFSLLVTLIETDTSDSKGICIENLDVIEFQNDIKCFSNDSDSIQQSFSNNCYCKLKVNLDEVLYFQHYFVSNNNISITAILEQRTHFPTTNGQLHIANKKALSLVGNGTKESVIVKGINLVLSDIGNTSLKNLTINNSSFNVYGATDLYSRTNITVENCLIINCQITLTDVILSIKDCEIKNCTHSAIVSYSSVIMLVGTVEFSNNTGVTGGALNLKGSRIILLENANVSFRNNQALEFGGAVFVDNADLYVSSEGYNSFCFYRVDSNYSLNFDKNVAEKGGDHIYGASLKSSCTATFRNNTCNDIKNCSLASYQIWTTNFHFNPPMNATESLSDISSKPTRVCLCNSTLQPQCTDIDSIFYEVQIYPGERFTIPAVIVGGDFGTTTGVVYAHFDKFQECSHPADDGHTIREQVIIQNKVCTNLTYCFYGNEDNTLNVYLTTNNMAEMAADFTITMVENSIEKYFNDYVIDETLLYTRTVLNITFRPCPPGFMLLESPLRCGCHPQLDGLHCTLKNGKGYISWNSSLWINAEVDGIIIKETCLFSYCKTIKKDIDLHNDPDAQCNFNRAGKACGECKPNYSLAIGSSRCIPCPNNNSLSLLIFFAAFGPLLVLVISILNLTVTQGTVNGLIFYANVVWAYQSILFPSDVLITQKLFIAWLNLDFGFETCFFRGMDAYSKTWLQFIFPVYTATLFFVGLRFSSKLSKLFGNRSVPTLATLLILSFTKLLRTIIAGLQLSTLTKYTLVGKSTEIRVWSLDGNLMYGKKPHIFLLLAALACLFLLWIPYTLILFSMQWLRKVDHHRPLKLIARYKPVYDAYFAPLKDKYHYWFGVLLLAQGFLLLMSSVLLNIFPFSTLLILLLVVLLMLCYLNFMKVYKKNVVTLLEGSFYINLILLTAGTLYLQKHTNSETRQEVLLTASIGIAFIKFCAVIIWNLISWIRKKYFYKAKEDLQSFQLESIGVSQDESSKFEYCRYRDSILN